MTDKDAAAPERWYLPGSLVEYAWTRKYPAWCRRVVPSSLEDASPRYRRIVQLLPTFARLKRRGFGYRRISKWLDRNGLDHMHSSIIRVALLFHGYVTPTAKLTKKIRRLIDTFAATGDFQQTAAVSGFCVNSVVFYLTELGLRARTLNDVAAKVRESVHIATADQIRSEFRVKCETPTVMLKLFPDLRELLAERRKKQRQDVLEEFESQGLPLLLFRSPRAVSVMLSLAKRPMPVAELAAMNGWRTRPFPSLAHLRLDELLRGGLVARSILPQGKQGRRVYVYALTPSGYDTLRKFLSVMADLNEEVSSC